MLGLLCFVFNVSFGVWGTQVKAVFLGLLQLSVKTLVWVLFGLGTLL